MKGMIVLTETQTVNLSGYMEPVNTQTTEATIFINPLLYEFYDCEDGARFIRYNASPHESSRRCKESLKEIATKIQESQH